MGTSLMAQTLLKQQSFESTTGWTMSHTFESGSDYAKRDSVFAGLSFKGVGKDGDFMMGFEDTQNGVMGSPTDGIVFVFFDSVDISGYSSLEVTMSVAANPTSGKYDQITQSNGDGFGIEAKIDNGNWVGIGTFLAKSGSNSGGLYLDLNGNFVGGDAGEPMLNDTLKDFTFSVAGTGSYLYLRTTTRMDSGDEELAYDNVRVHGKAGTSVGFNMASMTVDEGTDSFWVKVAANSLSSGTRTVDVAVSSSSTATNGTDFDFFSSTTLNFSSTSLMDSFKVKMKEDMDVEGMETIVFKLSNLQGSGTISTDSMTINITDNDFPMVSIEDLRKNDADGISLYDGQKVWTKGIVNISTSFHGSCLQIAFEDNGWGIGTFICGKNYVPVAGDSIMILGTISKFNGLTQFGSADTIEVLNTGNSISPAVVTDLDETTESRLVQIDSVWLVDSTQWRSSGSYNINFTNGKDTMQMRIDNDAISNWPVPSGMFNLVGIGGQFDNSAPHDEGYQLFPRSIGDIRMYTPYRVTIEELRRNDVNGISFLDGRKVATSGIVNTYSTFRGAPGLHISIQDGPWGVTVFGFNDDYGYSNYAVGDSIEVIGEMRQFNGLGELDRIDTIIVHKQGVTVDAEEVTALDETTESKLIAIKRVWMVDPGSWSMTSSRNYDITNGTDTLVMRVDSDTDIPGFNVPNDTFDLMGIGGQFDGSNPRDEGYQIFPRGIRDIHVDNYHVTIAQIRRNNADGISLLDGRKVTTRGVVNTGVSFRASGLQISMEDEGAGITLFGFNTDYGYGNFKMGDSVAVTANVRQFSGLCELDPIDTVIVEAQSITVTEELVTDLDEVTESRLVRLNDLELIDTLQWTNSGSGFNVQASNGTDTFVIRIDNDVDLFGQRPILGKFDIIGIGGQFDGSAPHDEGYQLFPRSAGDVLLKVGIAENMVEVGIYPNPTNGFVFLQAEEAIQNVQILNVLGEQVQMITGNVNRVDLSTLESGVYLLEGTTATGVRFNARVLKN